MFDEQMHAGGFLLGVVDGHQDAAVPDHGDREGDAEDCDLDFRDFFVASEGVGGVVRVRCVAQGSHCTIR